MPGDPAALRRLAELLEQASAADEQLIHELIDVLEQETVAELSEAG